MAGEAAREKLAPRTAASRLAAHLAACQRWYVAGLAAAVATVAAAVAALSLIALALAAAAGLVGGLREFVEVLLVLPLVSLAGLAAVLLPVDLPAAARLVQRMTPRSDDLLVTAAEALVGKASGSPAFLAALAPRALSVVRRVRPASFFAAAPWGAALPGAGAAAALLVLTTAVPGAWDALVASPPAQQAPAAEQMPGPQPPAPPPVPPALQVFALTIDPPPYTAVSPQTLRAPGDTAAPAGSRIHLQAEFSDCRAVAVAWASRRQRSDGPRLDVERTLTGTVHWSLTAWGDGGRAKIGPFVIRAVADRPPTAEILQPRGDVNLARPGPVKLRLAAADDYGLTAVALQWRLAAGGRWQEMTLPAAGGRSFETELTFDLRPMGLRAGDAVVVRLAATDNNAVGGPATAYSAIRRITIAAADRRTAERPVAQIEEMAAREEDAFARLRRDLDDLGAQLDRLQRQLGGEVSATERGQRQAELADIAARLKRSAEGAKRAMDDAQRRLKLEQLVDEEVMEKVAELQRLAAEVLDRQMKELLDRLQKAIKGADLEQLRANLERLQELRDRFVQQLDRTLELLKRARLEMMLEALARRLDQLADEQENIAQRTARLKDGQQQARREADRQADLARRTELMPQELQRAAERVGEHSQRAGDELAAVARRLESQDPAGEMRQAASALQRLAPSDAAAPQSRALQALREAAARLRGLQADVIARRRKQLQAEAGRAVAEALALARSHRQLMRESQWLENQTLLRALQDKAALERAAAQQRAVAEGAEKLAERLRKLAGQTPVAPPELAARTQAVAEAMMAAARAIQGGEGMAARMMQDRAMGQLNQLAADLVDLAAALGKESARMALSEYLKRLEQLAEQQRALNQRAQQAGEGNPLLSDLAAQQAMLKAALQKLMRGAGRELSDRLGGVPQDMDEVAKDLRARKLTTKTKTRQRDILRKMLDAQRSLYTKRQRSRRRVAERPKPYRPAPSPPAINAAGPPSVALPETKDTLPAAVPEAFRDVADAYRRRIGEGG